MSRSYDDAIEALYGAEHGNFVTERKRLAAELKAGGDASGAARLTKLARPPVSAWAVNQLWRQQRKTFEALLATAARIQRGDRAAASEHRELSAELRGQAAKLLTDAGHGSSDATLRRVSATLAALAASGGFESDAPGALSADRDPPGFEAFGIGNQLPEPTPPRSAEPARDTESTRDTESARERAAEAERRRKEQLEAERRQAERRRIEAALRDARKQRESRARDAERLKTELGAAEAALAQLEATIGKLESELADVEAPPLRLS